MTNSEQFLDGANTATENVLNADQAPQVQAEQSVQQDTTVYNEMVGEGKKFADPEALAKAKAESDAHIIKIQEENAELRRKAESSNNQYAAILDKLESKENKSVSHDNQDAQKNSTTPKEEIDIESLIESTLTKREQKIIKDANMASSRDLMVEAYGNVETAKKVRDEFLQAKPWMKGAINDLIENNPKQLLTEMTQFVAPESIGDSAGDPLATYNTQGGQQPNKYITWEEAQEVFNKDKIRYGSEEFTQLVKESEAYYKSKGVNYYNN